MFPVIDEPCPECRGVNCVRWVYSSENSDTWGCHDCGYEWLILSGDTCQSVEHSDLSEPLTYHVGVIASSS